MAAALFQHVPHVNSPKSCSILLPSMKREVYVMHSTASFFSLSIGQFKRIMSMYKADWLELPADKQK